MEPDISHFRFYAATRQKLGVSATAVHQELVQAWGDAAPTERSIYRWFQSHRESNDADFDDRPRSGRPTSTRTAEHVKMVEKLVKEDHHLSSRDIADLLDIDHVTVLRILKDELHLRNVCAVWVPHALTDENRRLRVTCAKQLRRELLGLGEDKYNLYAVEDETWVPWTPLRSKAENRTWITPNEPREHVVRPALTSKKTLLLVAFTPNKRFSVSAVPEGSTINAQRMIDFIRHTGDLWRTLRSHPIHLEDVYWQMDNARPHSAMTVQDYLHHRRTNILWQSPYSPDLNLCDRFLFSWMKAELRKSNFTSPEEVETITLQVLRSFAEDAIQAEVDKLIDHCQMVIESHGDYITS